MGPKKGGKGKKGRKGKKGKKGKPDSGWAKTIQWGTWSRPFESLPNPAVNPAFGAIRTEFLATVQELDMIWSKTLAEDFLEEVFSKPRPNLRFFCIRGAYRLKRFVLSPYEILTGLTRLDIGCMEELEFVLIQCQSLEWLSLSRSKSLKKALVESRNLKELVIDNCLKLESLIVCSTQMASLIGLEDSKELQVLFLDCHEAFLKSFKRPELYVRPKPKLIHPTMLQLRKWEDKQAPLPELEFGLLPKDLVVDDDCLREDIIYPNNPQFPRTHLQGF